MRTGALLYAEDHRDFDIFIVIVFVSLLKQYEIE
jgi:hypothetical protein